MKQTVTYNDGFSLKLCRTEDYELLFISNMQ